MTNKGYQVKEYHCPVKRYCQTMDLKDNPKLIKEYIRCHSKPEAWPEIRAGIRSVGILEMEIYILGSRLFMIIETPLDFNWGNSYGQAFSFTQTSRMGRVCIQISGVCTYKHLGREMEIDGANVSSI